MKINIVNYLTSATDAHSVPSDIVFLLYGITVQVLDIVQGPEEKWYVRVLNNFRTNA